MTGETPDPKPAEDIEAHGLRHQANEPVDEDTDAHGFRHQANEPVDEDTDAYDAE